MDLLTSTRLRTGRSCLQLHKFRFIDGIVTLVKAQPLRFGTLIHTGLEPIMRLESDDERIAAAIAAVQTEPDSINPNIQVPTDPFDRVKAEELLRGYVFRWGNDEYEVLAVERHFETPLVNPLTGKASRTWRLAGKIDAIVQRRRDGLIFIMEHKTSSEDITPGSVYWKKLRMDGQVSVYFEGARSLGYDIAGCIYDVIGKPSIKPLEATPMESRKYTKAGGLYANQREADEGPEQYRARLVENIASDPAGYYQRGVVTRLEDQMARAMHDIWLTAQHLHESQTEGSYPRNPDACVSFGRACDYFSVCAGEASIEDPTQFVKLSSPFPELAGEGTATAAEREGMNGHASTEVTTTP